MGFFYLFPPCSIVRLKCYVAAISHLHSNRLQSQRPRTSLQDGEEAWGEGRVFQLQYMCHRRWGNVTATQVSRTEP